MKNEIMYKKGDANMKKYEMPELEVVLFNVEDVITASDELGEDDLPIG